MSDKIQLLENKIKELQNQKKALLKKEKEEERKVRTKRLIERGALIEKYFSLSDDFSNENFKYLLDIFINDVSFVDYLEKAKNIVINKSNNLES